MMKKSLLVMALAAFLLAPVTASAQEDEKAPEIYIYGTYFECEVDGQWRVDEIAESVYKPVYDAAVKAGTIGSWGWLAHHTGGKWRRVLYYTAPSLEALLDAQEAIGKKVEEANAPASREVGRVCSAHDDYIWKQEVGPAVDRGRGAAGFSVYHHCKMTGEERADEIVATHLAPIYDRYVKEGKLASWGWSSHVVGGKWRRLATMTAKDHKSLLKARAAILEELVSKHGPVIEEFSNICGSHQDYMWDIQLETP